MVLKSISKKKYLKQNEINKKKKNFEFRKIKKLNLNLKILLIIQLIIIFLPFSYMDFNGNDANRGGGDFNGGGSNGKDFNAGDFKNEVNPDKNKITLIVNGKGQKQIYNINIIKPDIAIINNNEPISIMDNNMESFTLDQDENTIILKWRNLLTSCKEMFKDIDDIISIDFSYFDTSKVTEMTSMFYNSKAKSINFNNFNTSIVSDMSSMFAGSTQITSLDLSSFKTSKVKSMKYMFNYCMSLKELNLESFDTSSVSNMEFMFCHAESLILLNLYNFDTSSVTTMSSMFLGLKSLFYINLISFQEKDGVNVENIFSDISNNFIYCIDENKSPKISNILKSKEYINECENNCFSNSKIILVSKECSVNCVPYECKIEDNSVSSNPEESSNNQNINNENTENTENNENSKNSENSDDAENSENNENKNENTEEIKKNGNINDNEVIIDTTEKAKENNIIEIMKNFSSENFFKELNEIIIENTTIKDEIIKNIKDDIINGNLDSVLTNITKKKKDLLVKTNDILYQITTTENQKNNEYNNISTLDLGDCEDRLKKIYNIDKNLSLIIFKVDYYKEGSLIPVICYEIFHPLNKSQLDLNYCKDILINLNIPVSIDEDNYFKYDPNSEFYNDECYTYTTENGTDMILNDRQNEYNDNNLSICENYCTLTGYESEIKKASCECETKTKINLISEINEDKHILSKDFNNTDKSSSNIMKCYNTLFSKEGLLTNIGSYILLFTVVLCVLFSIIFYKCGYHIIETEIQQIISFRKKMNKKNIYDIKQNNKRKIMNKGKKTKRKSKVFNPSRRKSKQKFTNKKYNQNTTNSKTNLKKINLIINNQHIVNGNIIIYKNDEDNKNKNLIKFKNCELNYLNLEEALKYDKRTFFQYYISLLKIKILFLFSFYPIDDYNIKIIKIFLFFLFFDIYFAINTLFFNESTIHQIYKDKGEYNLKYFLPQIIYSFFISYIINSFIKFVCLSERNILKLKYEENLNDFPEKANKVKKCLVIKYILFFVLSLLFLILFWYYLSSFCAVYKNSQVYLIKNTFISFIISIVFPFIFYLFPSLFRTISLKNNGNKCFFQISKGLQLF